MKVARPYWFGLGSGLILSAMLTLSFSDSSPLVQIPEATQLQDLPSEIQSSSQINQDFVVPMGASAEQIADMLFSQGFIKDQATFLERAHQMEVERQFRAGTFDLLLGLTEEELIHRLLK